MAKLVKDVEQADDMKTFAARTDENFEIGSWKTSIYYLFILIHLFLFEVENYLFFFFWKQKRTYSNNKASFH